MPDIKSIEETIQKNIPAITVSTTRFFYDQTPTFDFHATVVIGCTERDFIIHDPLE